MDLPIIEKPEDKKKQLEALEARAVELAGMEDNFSTKGEGAQIALELINKRYQVLVSDMLNILKRNDINQSSKNKKASK